MRYTRTRRDSLRALTSEVLPYEVPIAFDTTQLYAFLRKLKFTWLDGNRFTVLNSRLTPAGLVWLRLIFDPVHIGSGAVIPGSPKLREFNLSGGGRKKPDLRHPYKFRSLRNNGKSRTLCVPHPHSMLRMAQFVHEYRDSILYYTSRSNFSIRHPRRVARVQVKPRSVFDGETSELGSQFEQSDLEYSHVSSYFSYHRYNNINRFYSSPEFRACERKYPHLMRADVAKCFDSVYTHTVSWVTNGIDASKYEGASKATFGGRFDFLMQYLNYAETSGIIIGPEVSRIFAEIILQEVDVRVERELANRGLQRGTDFEIMRYVDDYFIFLSDPRRAAFVENVLASNLALFKLHLNDQKQRHFSTPLQSRMSVAKLRIREGLRSRTTLEVDPAKRIALYMSANDVILDYKALLVDTDLEHAELANSYLHELGRRRDRTVIKYRERLADVRSGDARAYESAKTALVDYLAAVIDVAVFIYAGAPSVSHAIKFARIVAASVRELELIEAGPLLRRAFCDRIQHEIRSQLGATRDEDTFGAHTLLLIDCLVYLNPKVEEEVLYDIMRRRSVTISDLDAFAVLTLLRRFTDGNWASSMRSALLQRAKEIIATGKTRREQETERAILLLSLPKLPGVTSVELARVCGDAVSRQEMATLVEDEGAPVVFSWNIDDRYYEKLLLKTAQTVY